MKQIVFDSYALIALFRGEIGAQQVKELLVTIANDEAAGYITAVNAGEIYYMISRKSNSKIAESAINALLQMPIEITEPSLQLCLEAAAIKAKFSLSYADAFAAALAISKKATLITGDKEFENLKNLPGFKVKYLL